MNKIMKYRNGTIRAMLASTFVIALLFAMSCSNSGDDPDPELYSFPGVYTFNKAVLETEISFMFGVIPVNVPAGTVITDELNNGLLAEAPCNDENNGAIELKSNNELYFTCRTETNELKAGTWEYKESEKVLDLNLASPPLPAAIPLKIQDVVINAETSTVKGTMKSFPLSPNLLLGFLPASFTEGKTQEEIDAIKAQFPAVILVDISIEFQKVSE